jgi:hypothetical protein
MWRVRPGRARGSDRDLEVISGYQDRNGPGSGEKERDVGAAVLKGGHLASRLAAAITPFLTQFASARLPCTGGARADSPAGCLDPGAARDCLPIQAAPGSYPGAGARQAGFGPAHRSAGAGDPIDCWGLPSSSSGAARVCSAASSQAGATI